MDYNEVIIKEEKKDFLNQLLSGDFGLARTFWIYGVLFEILFALVISVLPFVGLLNIAWTVVVLIGTWRAANRYEGWRGWAMLARISVVLTWISLAVSLFHLLLMIFILLG